MFARELDAFENHHGQEADLWLNCQFKKCAVSTNLGAPNSCRASPLTGPPHWSNFWESPRFLAARS